MSDGASAQSGSFPVLYAKWMEGLLGAAMPEEHRATCSDCAMLPKPDEGNTEGGVFFNPRTKCCTFLPDLPNYLAGQILLDTSPEMARGRDSIGQRLMRKVEVSPLGIGQPSSYLLWYNHSKTGFGRSQSLRCPHYIEEGGLCGIWRHREATCATWFCKHDRGAAGQRFWRDGVHRLLRAIEGGLTRWCLLELDLGNSALERVMDLGEDYETIQEGELEGAVEPAGYRSLWGKWAGQEREFFMACAERVGKLNWDDVARICGPRVHLLARLTADYYAQLQRAEPAPALRCGSFRLISLRNETAELSTYNDYDPVHVPVRLLGVLQHFHGQPAADALRTIEEREKVTLDADLVRKLTDFRLLVPADHPAAEHHPSANNPETPHSAKAQRPQSK